MTQLIERRRTKRFPPELLGLLHRLQSGDHGVNLWATLSDGERRAILDRPDLCR